MHDESIGWFRNFIAVIGAQIIYALIWIFGSKREAEPWLAGPIGSDYIGDRPYDECAKAEGLSIQRNSEHGGLIPDFKSLDGPGFDSSKASDAVRHFYENTAEYRMDVWSKTWFPANLGLWLLVTTLSRKANQLNFPIGALDTTKGMDSEIVLLKRPDGSIRYTGWFRSMAGGGPVVYTGFYLTDRVPVGDTPCVKVVFPMPGGSATVLLRPSLDDAGNFHLSSEGKSFGDAGFYRMQQSRSGAMRIWRIRSLKEFFKIYVDEQGVLRCDHRVRFLGLPVLQLHFRLERRNSTPEVRAPVTGQIPDMRRNKGGEAAEVSDSR